MFTVFFVVLAIWILRFSTNAANSRLSSALSDLSTGAAESVYPASEAYWRHNQELANIRWISVYTPTKDTAGEVVGAIGDEQADRDESKRSRWTGSVGLTIDRFSALRHPLSTPAHR